MTSKTPFAVYASTLLVATVEENLIEKIKAICEQPCAECVINHVCPIIEYEEINA